MGNWFTPQNVPWMTKLDPLEEIAFKLWVLQNKIPVDPSNPIADYDMRGFWKAMKSGDPIAMRSAQNGHFPDVWKTPFHKTFSNESMYKTPNAPHWQGNKLMSPEGKMVFDESKGMK